MIWALVDLRGKFNYTTIQAVNKAVGFCQLPQLSSLFFLRILLTQPSFTLWKMKIRKIWCFYSHF